MKRLSELISSLNLAANLPADPEILAVTTDSRKAMPGCLFVAISGYQTDGHRYIADAIKRGASVIIYQDEARGKELPDGVLGLRVENSRRAAAVLADEFYDHPSGELTVSAITGTSGKTTTTLLLDSIYRAAGYKTGVIGTLGSKIGERELPGDRTTPDSIELQELFAEMVTEGVTHVSMEVSSHALYLDRTWMTAFAGAIFTNLSQDHLDFHADLDEYLEAKMLLFTQYPALAKPGRELVGAVNLDDPAGKKVLAQARCKCLTFGTGAGADVRATEIATHPAGVSFTLEIGGQSLPVSLQLSGVFNVHNSLAAAACAYGQGLGLDVIVAGLEGLAAVPGRFERVDAGQDFTVAVDYSHKPDALEKAIRSARALNPRRVLCLMGCGGDRDRDKRPKMGRIATREADFTIITSDNPRTEDPQAIIAEILAGLEPGAAYLVEPDRRAAIFAAVRMCEPGDLLLICGKGHETYQIFKNETVHFDDREVARDALESRK